MSSAETKAMTPPLPAANTTFSHQSSSTDDLPRAHIKRLMKHHLSQFTHVDAKTAQPFEPNIAKDALDGVQQACKIFIHYLTSTANDICAESKRSTLSADDVIRAVREIDFHELEPKLRDHLNQAKTAAAQRQALAASAAERATTERSEGPAKKQKTMDEEEEEGGEGDDEMGDDFKEEDDGGEEEEEDE
ncbi:unnamed protein product [Bathycoccus prasinos]